MSNARIVWKSSVLMLCLLAGFITQSGKVGHQPGHSAARKVQAGKPAMSFAKLPLSFESNQGQADRRVKFLSRGRGYRLFLTGDGAVLTLQRANQKAKVERTGELIGNSELAPRRSSLATAAKSGLRASINGRRNTGSVLRLRLEGSNPKAVVAGANELPGRVNYLYGNAPRRWHTNLPTYAKVKYQGVYPGVDLVYYGNQGQLEFDFLLSQGASAKPIRLRFGGATLLRLGGDGNLMVTTLDVEITFHRPVVYQEIGGSRHSVKGGFKLVAMNTVGFTLGHYDHSLPLTIDPILVYSTYMAGVSDAVTGVAADAAGNAYVAGRCETGDYPTTPGAYQTFSNPPPIIYDSFVTKINPSGTALIYSTFIGGLGSYLIANAIAVDGEGNAYVAGSAEMGLPVTPGAFQTVNKAVATNGSDGFVTKINPTGAGLVYSTYLGGSSGDVVNAIAVDASGSAYVAGVSASSDFPTTPGAYQSVVATPSWPRTFFAKLNATGTSLVYSSLLQGNGIAPPNNGIATNQANGIAVDTAGNAYVVGVTDDESFPTTSGSFQPEYSPVLPALAFVDAGYVAKFNATGSQLLYSSYLGGTYASAAEAVAVDTAGNAYVTGYTTGNFITTPGAFQTKSFAYNAFVVKINPAGSALVYSSYLGGSCMTFLPSDAGFGIAVDALGDAYVAGQTCSLDFPLTTMAVQPQLNAPYFNAFLSVVNPTGNTLLYSTYLGGSGGGSGYFGDWAMGIATYGSGNAYIAGIADSTDFPTTAGALYSTNSVGGKRGQGF